MVLLEHLINDRNEDYGVGFHHIAIEQLKYVFKLNIEEKNHDTVSKLLEASSNGDIFFTYGFYYTEDRAKTLEYADYYVKDILYLYSDMNLVLKVASDFNNLKYGKVQAAAYFETIKEDLVSKGINVESVEFESEQQMHDALENGVIDFIPTSHNIDLIKRGFKYMAMTDASFAFDDDALNVHAIGEKSNKEVIMLFSAMAKAYDYGLRDNVELYRQKYMDAVLLNNEFLMAKILNSLKAPRKIQYY